jgi:predicted nucleic acid-binding protein
MQKPKLVAVDSNVLILLAQGDDATLEACETIRTRIKPVQLVATPIVISELTHKSKFDAALEKFAKTALTTMRSKWRCEPAHLNAIQQAIAARASTCLNEGGLLPTEERNDAHLLAQAAALDATLLITYDSHLRDIDFERLTLLFHELDLSTPVIATPAEVVTKFFR